MTIPKSSTCIYHVVLGSTSQIGIFKERSDYKKFMDVMRLYKASLNIKVLGYSLSPLIVHLILHDRNRNLYKFISSVQETYLVYFQKKYFVKSVFHHTVKAKPVESYDSFVNLYKYIHKMGENSYKRFQMYDSIKKDEYIDGDYVLSAFGSNREKAKVEMNSISVQECPEYYGEYVKKMEHFNEGKKSIRIRRAEKFLCLFLDDNNMVFSDLEKEDFYNKKLELIREFRDKTDISYRDIGEILELSHTSIIRLWKIANERANINCFS